MRQKVFLGAKNFQKCLLKHQDYNLAIRKCWPSPPLLKLSKTICQKFANESSSFLSGSKHLSKQVDKNAKACALLFEIAHHHHSQLLLRYGLTVCERFVQKCVKQLSFWFLTLKKACSEKHQTYSFAILNWWPSQLLLRLGGKTGFRKLFKVVARRTSKKRSFALCGSDTLRGPLLSDNIEKSNEKQTSLHRRVRLSLFNEQDIHIQGRQKVYTTPIV